MTGQKRKIRLDYAIKKGMFKYPSDPELAIERMIARVEPDSNDPGIWDESGFLMGYSSGNYKSSWTEFKNLRSHHGTHIDFPSHKLPGGKNSKDYENKLEKFENLCRLVDLTKTDLLRRKKRVITAEDLINHKPFFQYRSSGALIFYTGFCDEMAERENKLAGEDKTNFEKTFPYFSEDATRYIIENCVNLNIVGIDSFSVDRQGSNSEIHRIFFSKDILILETLVNLKELKKATCYPFKLHSVPLNYELGDAAQTPAYAEVDSP